MSTKKKLKSSRKEKRKLERVLRLEADLIERLERLRRTKIFQDNPFVLEIKTSKEKPPETHFRKDSNGKKKVRNRVSAVKQSAATSKRQRRYSLIYASLEDACERFKCYCCECGQELKVHAHGVGYPIKVEVISAACWNKECSRRGTEVKFSGVELQVQASPELIANAGRTLGIVFEFPTRETNVSA